MTRRNRRTFGCVRKLPSGKYQASYLKPSGTRQTAPETFQTRFEADKWLAGIRTDIYRGDWKNPEQGLLKLKQFIQEYMSQKKSQLAPKTFEGYENLIQKCIVKDLDGFNLGELQLNIISPQTIKKWYGKIKDQHPPSISAYSYRVIRAIFSEAVRDEYIETNPCRIKGAGNTKRKRRVPPTIFQINELIGKTPERYKVAVLFAALSGLRKGEQFALRRGDLNLIQGTVTVERSQLKLRNKPLTYGEPKSEAGKRTIALPQLLVERLKNHLENFSDSNLDSLVFTTESGSPVQKLGSWWNQARKELEFTYTWHDLRHTAGVLTGQQGATLAELMHRLGHSTVNAAMIYQHSTKQRDFQIAKGIDTEIEKILSTQDAG